MPNGIRTGDPLGFNKGRCSKFHVGSRVWQRPEKGRWTYRPKRCGNNDEDKSPKALNDKNQQDAFQKFWQLLEKFYPFQLSVKHGCSTKKKGKGVLSLNQRKILEKRISLVIFTAVGRLNGVIPLVTAFQDLSHITSPFWSRENVKREIRPFQEQDFEVTRRASSFLLASILGLPPLYSTPEMSKLFPSFCCVDFSACSLNTCDSCIASARTVFLTRIMYY